ncbi:cell division protein DedD [Atlantibacter hermannii]|uniref:cell division protein DedD n=1 Tax=Atlantibacter hermannii TaxID=565 RepID=UPI00193285B5|nr:cell division protein DedD [Atlantibacter hermannii]MBL7673515.1 cell division protein DedD [Atlantibacter hermannii]
MASKFQNRLVGTIVLVALGVILLPGLLDGQKKHYQDEFAAIPLVPKPGDTDEPDMLPAATQALPAQPPEGAAEEVRAANAAASAIDTDRLANNANNLDPLPEPEPVPPTKPKAQDTPKKPQTKPQKDKTDEQLAMLSEEAPPKKAEPAKPDTPAGKAYVVQLGALKNADKVNEIVGKLRGAGYRVYTSPTTPVQGKITRILVGPDASRDKLKGSLSELNQLSGLNGVVMNYSVN